MKQNSSSDRRPARYPLLLAAAPWALALASPLPPPPHAASSSDGSTGTIVLGEEERHQNQFRELGARDSAPQD